MLWHVVIRFIPLNLCFDLVLIIMPRDLFNRQPADQAESLTASPDAQTPRFGSFAEQMRVSGANENENLHPYIQTLTLSDVESCVALENATFPKQERCSKEKVQ